MSLVRILLLFADASAGALTEAEVAAEMNEAFALKNAKKTVDAMDAFLLVGEIRNSSEMKLSIKYMCAVRQWLVCVMRHLKRYEEAYRLAKKLMTGQS